MFANKPFVAAFLTSLMIHGFVLWGIPGFSMSRQKTVHTQLRVQYVQPEEPKYQRTRAESVPPFPNLEKKSPRSLPVKNTPKPSVATKIAQKTETLEPIPIKKFSIKQLDKTSAIDNMPAVVDLNNLGALKKNTTFLSYYQSIRERISRYAMLNYPSQFIEGEVSLSFTLRSDGALVDVGIIDFKSSRNRNLRTAAVKSIKEASPFKPFPDGLPRRAITFNIIIAFEIKHQ